MKPILATLLFLLVIVSTNCQHTVSPESSDTVDQNYTTDLNQGRKWFEGKWKLTTVSAMIPSPTVPDVQLIVNKNQITLIQDGKQTDQVSFEIIQTPYDFQLKTNSQYQNGYLGNSGLRISRNRLFIDKGMANDFPGFEFKRME